MENYKIWTTKYEQKIPITDMTTRHIQLAIAGLEDGRIAKIINCGWAKDNDYIEYMEDENWKNNWIKSLKSELKRRKVK